MGSTSPTVHFNESPYGNANQDGVSYQLSQDLQSGAAEYPNQPSFDNTDATNSGSPSLSLNSISQSDTVKSTSGRSANHVDDQAPAVPKTEVDSDVLHQFDRLPETTQAEILSELAMQSGDPASALVKIMPSGAIPSLEQKLAHLRNITGSDLASVLETFPKKDLEQAAEHVSKSNLANATTITVEKSLPNGGSFPWIVVGPTVLGVGLLTYAVARKVQTDRAELDLWRQATELDDY